MAGLYALPRHATMAAMGAPDHKGPTTNPLLYPLHLSLAGIFAFILPFICWGALATPGHPHGLPHFVFFAPQSLKAANTTGDDAVHASHAAATPENASDSATEPAAQSVTPVLGVALLAPIILLLASLLAPALRHFTRRPNVSTYSSVVMPPVPPPPRLMAAIHA